MRFSIIPQYVLWFLLGVGLTSLAFSVASSGANRHPAPVIAVELDENFDAHKLSSVILREGRWIPHGEVIEIDRLNSKVYYMYYQNGVNVYSRTLTHTSGLRNAPLLAVVPSLDQKTEYFK